MTVRIGRLEIAFGIGLIVYVCLSLIGQTGIFTALLKLILLILGAWLAIRISRAVVKSMLWRLRNRLIVAYFFIAVVPIILMTLLAGLGVALVGGQISIYLVTSELDRRTVTLRSTVDFLASDLGRSSQIAATVGPFLHTRFPGVQIVIRDAGLWTYPPRRQCPTPSKEWPQGNGLMVRDGQLYGWAAVTHGTRTVFAAFPVTREFLGMLVPDIGESIILNLERNHVLLHPSLPDAPVPSRNRLLPAVNLFDFQIWWGAPISATLWDRPARRRQNGSTCGPGLPPCSELFFPKRSTSPMKRSRCSSSGPRSYFSSRRQSLF